MYIAAMATQTASALLSSTYKCVATQLIRSACPSHSSLLRDAIVFCLLVRNIADSAANEVALV